TPRSILTISSTLSDEISNSRKKASVSIAALRRICGARSFGRPDFCEVDVELENGVIYLRPPSPSVSASPRGGCGLMSALGQKQTCAVQNGMSALPPIATPKADSRKRPCPLYPQ